LWLTLGHRVEPLGRCLCSVGLEVPLMVFPYAMVCKGALCKTAQLVEGSGGSVFSETDTSL